MKIVKKTDLSETALSEAIEDNIRISLSEVSFE